MPGKFTLARPVIVERANAYGGGKTVRKYVPAPEIYGTFDTREAAKRSFAEAFEVELKGAPDEFIARHFAVWARNHFIRIARVS